MTSNQPIQSLINKAFSGLVVLMLVFAFPSQVIAEGTSETSADPSASTAETKVSTETEETEEISPENNNEQTAAKKKTGTQQPTGADSSTYTRNEKTGNWENDKYSWNPDTKQTKPKQEAKYSYNPATKRWDTTEYVYHPESGKYVPNVKSTSQPPRGSQSINGTGPNSNNQISGSGSGGSSINGTGPNSNNTIDNGGSTNGTFDLFFNGSISNNINSTAASGDATVQSNTNAGDALTGNASNLVNVVNMLQSSFLDANSNMSGFVFDVDGDVYGDLYIDPSALPVNNGGDTNIDVNVSNNAAINNDINVDSRSGNAKVANNTNGGSAQSGDADAVVNLVNLINSAILSGSSFMGVLNINGNLNGDILLPQSLLDGLIALSGPGSNNQITSGGNTDVDVNAASSKTISNNIDASASSGDANVSGNTNAGGATSGQAKTSTETINLVGQDISGKNGLLVFINVLGSWVGLSLTPSSSAAITNTGPDSNNTINGGGDTSISVDAEENSLINNNVTANASSGDATVSGNTTAGGAKSGNANVAVNVLNLMDTKLNVDDWFGALFINVFGSWKGSFGLNTDAGNAKSSTASNSNTTRKSTGSNSSNDNQPAVLAFVPNTSRPNTQQNFSATNSSPKVKVDAEVKADQVVAGASSAPKDGGGTVGPAAASDENRLFALPAWSILIALIALPLILFGEKLLPLARTRFGLFQS